MVRSRVDNATGRGGAVRKFFWTKSRKRRRPRTTARGAAYKPTRKTYRWVRSVAAPRRGTTLFCSNVFPWEAFSLQQEKYGFARQRIRMYKTSYCQMRTGADASLKNYKSPHTNCETSTQKTKTKRTSTSAKDCVWSLTSRPDKSRVEMRANEISDNLEKTKRLLVSHSEYQKWKIETCKNIFLQQAQKTKIVRFKR